MPDEADLVKLDKSSLPPKMRGTQWLLHTINHSPVNVWHRHFYGNPAESGRPSVSRLTIRTECERKAKSYNEIPPPPPFTSPHDSPQHMYSSSPQSFLSPKLAPSTNLIIFGQL